jgi:cellulose synthase/poly-beta-1,6-N-acetylglucosamine synthase-like glycosyltransferase
MDIFCLSKSRVAGAAGFSISTGQPGYGAVHASSKSGGWQYDTLCEDLDLSYRAQLAGWKFIYLSDVVTPAELPVDMNGFKSQQHRWTKGSVQTCKKLLPSVWRSRLPFRIKLEATGHLMSNFAYLLLALLCVLLYPSTVGLRSAGFAHCLSISQSSWRHRLRSAFFTFARNVSCIRERGSKNSFFCHVCLR